MLPPAFDFTRAPAHLIRRLHQVATALFAQQTASNDITPVQFAILQALQQPSPMDQVSVAQAVALDPATSGGVIGRLEAKGCLQRVPDAQDKRRKLLSLTPQGQALAQALVPPAQQVQRELLAPLSAAEQAQLLDLLTKCVQGHQPISPSQPQE